MAAGSVAFVWTQWRLLKCISWGHHSVAHSELRNLTYAFLWLSQDILRNEQYKFCKFSVWRGLWALVKILPVDLGKGWWWRGGSIREECLNVLFPYLLLFFNIYLLQYNSFLFRSWCVSSNRHKSTFPDSTLQKHREKSGYPHYNYREALAFQLQVCLFQAGNLKIHCARLICKFFLFFSVNFNNKLF